MPVVNTVAYLCLQLQLQQQQGNIIQAGTVPPAALSSASVIALQRCATVTRWTTSPWRSSSRAWHPAVHGPALTSSIASTLRCAHVGDARVVLALLWAAAGADTACLRTSAGTQLHWGTLKYSSLVWHSWCVCYIFGAGAVGGCPASAGDPAGRQVEAQDVHL